MKATRFSPTQLETWRSRLADTFDAQREMLFGTLHGIYCDPSSGEEARVDALSICQQFTTAMTPQTLSALVGRHEDYRAKGDEARHKASQQFFATLGKLALLGETEMHGLITTAAAQLLSVHNAFNNFYNEPPFADRLASLSSQNRVPESAQFEFVNAVVTCATGNRYGVCHAALPADHSMIKSFSPAEIKIMLDLPSSTSTVGARIRNHNRCKAEFKDLVGLLDSSSVPTFVRSVYEKWLLGGP